ncbi:uncharacterized protein C8Q71DRAFT_792342 [Rhodofomes roseus]|uniref:Uncharacterized protein n=1 Tax=Rhodofomes roseus TaxID=34475 RepID=A0ABQ8JYK0_9APHY|nr:uncharacterized protein C8Q71DRAFT_792342 [Rhodofomes roseus]KAH9828760.1 hypothetical protein C8Q71DRAFT_792342 [Rhodofomes roseus]
MVWPRQACVVRRLAENKYETMSSDVAGLVDSAGRSFAANELKIMLACIVTVVPYDVKFREEGRRPEWLATSCYPCRTAEVPVFQRRRDVSAS